MNLYPSLVAQMGSWKYYIVKMKMREVASEVKFATEVYEDRTLDEAIQRELREGRVRKEIVTFLSRRKDRFFASLVVAAVGGNPKFYPVKITDDPQFAVFTDQGLDESFGVLTFSGDQKYYALDGQHRLKAIKTLLDRSDPLSADCPESFPDEEISVLIVVRREEPEDAFLESYRRLFSSLNRYAKPTDMDTNIIMDEDDTFAILTRRLLSEHEFFKWAGAKQSESPRVKTKGKNLKESDPHFTSLQTLYAMNTEILSSSWRRNSGWGTGNNGELEKDVKLFTRFRPSEEYLDLLYKELVVYWDALIAVLPILKGNPLENRAHDPDSGEEDGVRDLLIFWPIGQDMLARLARRMLDRYQNDEAVKNPTLESASKAISRLAKVSWELHRPPWRFLLLTQSGKGWRMRSEDRVEAVELASRLVGWLVGLWDYNTSEVNELKADWKEKLIPPQEASQVASMWEEILGMRSKILQ
jgi:DGQHR domain-containing protein